MWLHEKSLLRKESLFSQRDRNEQKVLRWAKWEGMCFLQDAFVIGVFGEDIDDLWPLYEDHHREEGNGNYHRSKLDLFSWCKTV